MKHTHIYTFITLIVFSLSIHGSDDDSSPESTVRVPYLNLQAVQNDILLNATRQIVSIKPAPLKPLHKAVYDNNLEDVKTLLQSNVMVDAFNSNCQTPLAFGVFMGCNVLIIEELIKAGANVNKRDFLNETPLIDAVEKGNSEHVAALLRAGAEVKGISGVRDVLSLAVRSNKLDIVKMLIAAKAEVNPPSHKGASPLLRSIYTNDVKMVQILLDAGAKVNHADDKCPELEVAVLRNHLPIVKVLVNAGANVNAQGGHCSILYFAKKNPEMKAFLLSKGAVLFWGDSIASNCSIQ